MSARDELRDCFLSDSRSRFEAAADAFRAEVLREAIDAIQDPKQRCLTSVGSGLGYESALAVLRRMADAAVSGSTAGDEQAETAAEQLRNSLRAEALREAAAGAYLNVHASAAEGVHKWLLRLADIAEGGAR